MRINYFLGIIALLISVLLAYLLYIVMGSESAKSGILLFGAVNFAATLVGTMSFRVNDSRININIRVLSTLFFIVSLILNLVFYFFAQGTEIYIIVSSIVLLIYLSALYKLLRVGMKL